MSDKKQKVLIVHNYYQIPGGEDTVVENEKRMLEEHGHEVLLYTRHNSELKTLSRFQKLLLPFSTVFQVRTYREVRNLIEKEKIDLLHVHNTLNLVSPSVYYAGFSKKIPVVQTIHNFRMLCPGATFYRDGQVCEDCLKKGLTCAVKHKCYRGSRIQSLACVLSTWIHRMLGTYGRLNYICLTEFNKKKLLNLKQVKEEKVFVKPNFVPKAERILSYQERENQFVYVGRLDKLKGVDLLLHAWKKLNVEDWKLVLCGTGPLEKWCKAYIKENSLKNVEFKGFVENARAREIIGKSKALILPTRWYEGFPMTIAESYAVGTPVIGSNLGNTGDLIAEGNTGWKFLPGSVEDLVLALQKAMKQPMILKKDQIEKYSEESNYQLLRNIYETCCDHH